MMSSVLILVMLAVFTSVSPPLVFAQSEPTEVIGQDMLDSAGPLGDACRSAMLEASIMGLLAQGECCSNAGGFCGCSERKVRCCNGTTPPSCVCRSDGQWSLMSGPAK